VTQVRAGVTQVLAGMTQVLAGMTQVRAGFEARRHAPVARAGAGRIVGQNPCSGRGNDPRSRETPPIRDS